MVLLTTLGNHFEQIPHAYRPHCHGWSGEVYVKALYEFTQLEDIKTWKLIFSDTAYVKKLAIIMIKYYDSRTEPPKVDSKIATKKERKKSKMAVRVNNLTGSICSYLHRGADRTAKSQEAVKMRLFGRWTAFMITKLYARNQISFGDELIKRKRRLRVLGQQVVDLFEELRDMKNNSSWFNSRLSFTDEEETSFNDQNIKDDEVSDAEDSVDDIDHEGINKTLPEFATLEQRLARAKKEISTCDQALADHIRKREELEQKRKSQQLELDRLADQYVKECEDKAAIHFLRTVMFPNINKGFDKEVEKTMMSYRKRSKNPILMEAAAETCSTTKSKIDMSWSQEPTSRDRNCALDEVGITPTQLLRGSSPKTAENLLPIRKKSVDNEPKQGTSAETRRLLEKSKTDRLAATLTDSKKRHRNSSDSSLDRENKSGKQRRSETQTPDHETLPEGYDETNIEKEDINDSVERLSKSSTSSEDDKQESVAKSEEREILAAEVGKGHSKTSTKDKSGRKRIGRNVSPQEVAVTKDINNENYPNSELTENMNQVVVPGTKKTEQTKTHETENCSDSELSNASGEDAQEMKSLQKLVGIKLKGREAPALKCDKNKEKEDEVESQGEKKDEVDSQGEEANDVESEVEEENDVESEVEEENDVESEVEEENDVESEVEEDDEDENQGENEKEENEMDANEDEEEIEEKEMDADEIEDDKKDKETSNEEDENAESSAEEEDER